MRDNELREEVKKLKKDLVYNHCIEDNGPYITTSGIPYPHDMPIDTARKVERLDRELKALYELLGVTKESKKELLKMGKKEAVITYPNSIRDILRNDT